MAENHLRSTMTWLSDQLREKPNLIRGVEPGDTKLITVPTMKDICSSLLFVRLRTDEAEWFSEKE